MGGKGITQNLEIEAMATIASNSLPTGSQEVAILCYTGSFYPKTARVVPMSSLQIIESYSLLKTGNEKIET